LGLEFLGLTLRYPISLYLVYQDVFGAAVAAGGFPLLEASTPARFRVWGLGFPLLEASTPARQIRSVIEALGCVEGFVGGLAQSFLHGEYSQGKTLTLYPHHSHLLLSTILLQNPLRNSVDGCTCAKHKTDMIPCLFAKYKTDMIPCLFVLKSTQNLRTYLPSAGSNLNLQTPKPQTRTLKPRIPKPFALHLTSLVTTWRVLGIFLLDCTNRFPHAGRYRSSTVSADEKGQKSGNDARNYWRSKCSHGGGAFDPPPQHLRSPARKP
jgi:hypothetical protein